MKKKEARVINAIPHDKTLIEYFDSLDVFDKREMIEELKEAGRLYSKNTTRKILTVVGGAILCFLCYLGIRETWAAYYLTAINIPLILFGLHDIKKFTEYNGLARYFEKRMSEQ